MDITVDNSEEQKAYYTLRITDIGREPLEMFPSISGYENMSLVPLETAVEPLVPFLPDIQIYASTAKQQCRKPPVDRLSNDESASIMLYTMGWKPLDQCLSVVLNNALRSKERNQVEPWFLYLKLFLTALSRLPSIHQNIYREIELDLTKQYQIDEIIIWWGFSSCKTSNNLLQSVNTTNTRTLFRIECFSGKNIRQHSYFQLEDEILLFPATQFKVQTCSDQNNGVHFIQLQEIQSFTPLLYPLLSSAQSNKSFSNELIYVGNLNFNGLSSSHELKFRKGDKLEILERHVYNAWWKAKNFRTKEIGYVPTNSISPIIDLATCEWYFTQTNRHEANRFLQQAHNGKGTFLIRPSETNQSEEALSILDFNNVQHFHVKHYRIRRTDEGLYYIQSRRTFPSLQDLVNYYHQTTDGLCCALTHPCRQIESIAQDGLVELDRSQLLKSELLGRGNYGEVYKGTYGQRDVAIKYIKIDDENQFLDQAEIMEELSHKNILRLYGVCTQEKPILIVTEFMTHGCLLNYLRDALGKNLIFKTLLNFAGQIIKGMIYLEEEKCVHCDLAARSIFVGESNVVKIGGFSSAKVLRGDRLMIDEESQFSARWIAPEVVMKKEYTTKSDVWSFGILLYELITYGSNPYPEFSDDEVLQKVLEGYRMTKPNDCHEEYYQIMQSCWQDNPDDRPTFEQLSMRFDEFIKQVDSIDRKDTYTELL